MSVFINISGSDSSDEQKANTKTKILHCHDGCSKCSEKCKFRGPTHTVDGSKMKVRGALFGCNSSNHKK